MKFEYETRFNLGDEVTVKLETEPVEGVSEAETKIENVKIQDIIISAKEDTCFFSIYIISEDKYIHYIPEKAFESILVKE